MKKMCLLEMFMRNLIDHGGHVFVLILITCGVMHDVVANGMQSTNAIAIDIPKFLGYEFGSKQLFNQEYKTTVALHKPFGPFETVTLYFNCDKELEMLEFVGKGAQWKSTVDFCEKYFYDNYGMILKKHNKGSAYSFAGTNVTVSITKISSAICACVIENLRYRKEPSPAQILSNYDPDRREQLEIGAKRLGRTALEQLKYERDMPMPNEFCGFVFGSKEYYLPPTNYVDKFNCQRKSDASRRKIALKEMLCGIGEAELRFTEDGELYSVVLEAEYKSQSKVDLRDLAKEVADIFARKYSVVCIEDKGLKSFSFWREDFHLFIQVIEAQPWRRGVRVSATAGKILAAGRKRAAERKKKKYANLIIPGVAGVSFGSTNFVGATIAKKSFGYSGVLNTPYGLLSQVEVMCGISGLPKIIRLKTNVGSLTSKEIRDEESRIVEEFKEKYGIEFGRNLCMIGAPTFDYHFTSDNYKVCLYRSLKGCVVLEVEDKRVK